MQYGILGFFLLGTFSIERSRFFAVVCSMALIPLGWMLEMWGGAILATLVAGWFYKE